MSEITKRVIALFLCIAVALGIFTNVYADSNVLRIAAVEISSKSETADVETPSISNNQVQGGVVFNAQDDYAEYLFTIENTDEYAYRIDSIEDDNSVDALSITYSHDEKVAAGATAHATMRLTYTDLLLNQEAVDISDLQIQIHFTRINEKPEDNPGDDSGSEETINVNPNTNDGLTIFVFGSSVALFVAMFALRNMMPRKVRIMGDSLALVLAGSAFGIHAVRAANIEEIDIKFSNIHLASEYEEYVVYIDTGNGPVAQQVAYGTPLSEILVRPTKTGYHFVKWTDTSGNDVDENGIIEGPITIVANMAPNQYHVVFNINNGSATTMSQTMTYDLAANLDANSFSFPGYKFDGWATSADGDKVYEDKAEVSNLTTGTDNVNLYAKWIKRTDIRYVVRHSYEKLMEDGYTNEDIELQGSIGVDYTPERQPRTGYVTPDRKTEQISADGSTVIEYVYNLERKTLGLNDADYIETQTPAGEYKYGYPISLTAKSREGYNFAGWNNGPSVVSEATTYNFNIQDNITLTPTYTKKRFDVTINYNNGSAQEVKSVEYGTVLSTILVEPSKIGFHFVKWVDGNNQDIDTSSAVTSAMTISAVLDANKYHVVFNANSNSATGNMSSQEFTYSETKNLTSNAFNWPGYHFDGWARSADGEVEFENGESVSNLTTGTDDVNLYAKWSLITSIHYTVVHRYQKVTGDEYDTDTRDFYDGDVECLIEPARIPRTGHETPAQISEHISPDGDTVFTYTYPREVYHLTLNDADYITTETPASDYRYGREISLTAQNRESEGYGFLGWNNGSTIVSEDITYSFMITSNVELTPEYAKKKLTVVVDPNNGTQATTYNNVEYGTQMSTLLPEQPSKTGHAFVNWTDADSNVVTSETTVTSALTVTANYQPNTYHVVFNPNGATGEMASQSFVYGTSQNLTQNAFSWAGYIFDGWATSADGGVEYTNGQNVSNLTTGTDDVNLYAKWHKRTDISYVVTHRFQQAVDGDVFDVDNPDDELQGSVDTEYAVTVRSKAGFQTPSPEPFTINADGSTHIYVDYYRETRTLGLGNTDYVTTETPAGDYRYEYPISLTAVARTGYDFLGWHNGTKIVSTDTTYNFDLTDNITLEPRYQIQSYAVSIDKSDDNGAVEHTIEYGTSLAEYLTNPGKTGYHLVNWTNNNSNVVTGETVVTGPMTITANIAPNVYNVAFNANGGTGAMNKQEMTYDTQADLAPNIFTRPGYTFGGWATSAAGTAIYEDGESVGNLTTDTNDVELFATWVLRTDIPYKVYHRYENVGSGFTQVKVNAQGSIDTDITPETLPKEGFGDPVADANTPIPGQIQLDGSSYFIYNYYRQTRQLTINDYQYVITDTYSGSYKYGKQITLQAADRVAYEFAGWQKVTSECEAPNCGVLSTESEYTFTLTEDTIIVPVYNAAPFRYVFNHPGQCVFSSEDPISGDDCEYAGAEYIDTGVKLFNEANYNVDYEIGFTIDEYEDEQVPQATLMNAKYEYSLSTSPGIAVRKSGNTANAEITQAINGSKVEVVFNSPARKTVRIVRIDGIVYTSINGLDLVRLQTSKGTSDYHDITTWFGASYNPNDSVDNPVWRRFNGKLSNMYIKMGTYDVSPTVTVTYNVEDGTVSPTSQRIPVGQTIKDFPIPVSNSGQNFMSWYKHKNGDTWSDPVVENVTTFNEDTTLYARWASTNDACEINGSAKGTLDECVSIAKQAGTSSNPALITILKDLTNVQIDTTTGHYIKIDGRGFNLTSKTNKYILENTGGDITVEDVNMILIANQAAINAKGGTVNVNGVHIAVDNIANCRQGIYLGSNASAVVNVYGGTTIYSECSQRAPIQIDTGTIYIEDAEITAKNHFALDGSRVSGTGKFVLGRQDGTANTATPVIRSDKANSNAIKLGGKTLEFYDGQASSQGAVVNGGTITATEQGAVQQTTPLNSNYSTYNWLYYTIP